MSRILVDVTLPISDRLPVWPGDPPVRMARVSEGLPMVSWLSMSVHAGTHVDAPAHFMAEGATVERLPLDVLMGSSWVVCIAGQGMITAVMLAAAGIPEGTIRLLIRTDNSDRAVEAFETDFVSLTPDAAEWLLARHFRLVGIDGPSIEAYAAPGDPVHRSLWGAGVIIVENLALGGIASGAYELICLPLPIAGSDGAPARVVLATMNDRP
jgi:arylformamidase